MVLKLYTNFDWFKSFICDRIQYTSTDLKQSSTKIVFHGVLQVSVLGPLLFIIFINDLKKSVKNSKVHRVSHSGGGMGGGCAPHPPFFFKNHHIKTDAPHGVHPPLKNEVPPHLKNTPPPH